MTNARVVLATFPSEQVAANIARVLVQSHLAACVNIVPGARSIYRWQDEVCDEAEVLAVIKTTSERFESMREKLVELHPYECPEVLALDVTEGHAPYVQWLLDNTR